MNEMHEANRKYWDEATPEWQKLDESNWRKCAQEPSLAFEGAALDFIKEFAGELKGKRVCIIGSGDNYAAFGLAGMGAAVTSTDISEPRLDVARQRARELGLDIQFVRCDAAGLSFVPSTTFDLMCSTNGFFVWISDLAAVFSAVYRVLKPGGYYVFYDIHPFQRPWKDQNVIEMEKPYYETGPFKGDDKQPTHYFHWTLSDIANSLLKSGLSIRRVAESPAVNSRFWGGLSYGPGKDQSLQDWHNNPRAGLPVWLTVAAQKQAPKL
ncbi:MAG: class I SAM-dependent methyltransferase [Chloroflexi bacterium]|nr:class I SAM-dependent methyltransferase [Chloroflexota bacterium]